MSIEITHFLDQKDYGKVLIISNEIDIIEITQKQSTELNLIQIERQNIPKLIEILKKIV